MVIPKKTYFSRFKSRVQHFPGGGTWKVVQLFRGGGGSRVQLVIPTLSTFLFFFLPLGTSDGYLGIPNSEGVS